MPKPMELAQWRVGFCRSPPQISVTIDDVPVVARDATCLVANPADVAVFEETGIREDERVGLIGAQLFDDVGEIVDMTGAAGAVQPEFRKFTVILREFIQFGGVILVVFRGVAIAGLMTVPRREINAELQTVLSCGGSHLG